VLAGVPQVHQQAPPPPQTPLPPHVRGLDLLYALACRGRWAEVTSAAVRQLGDTSTQPAEVLALVTMHALALSKQRLYNAADDILRGQAMAAALRDAIQAQGEQCVPFALHLLRAELPQHLGRPGETVDALCMLHDTCVRHARSATDGSALWRRRAWSCVCRLVVFHTSRGELRSALAWLDMHTRDTALCEPHHVLLARQAAAHVFLQAGDPQAAAAAAGGASHEPELLLANRDFVGAARAFHQAYVAAPTVAILANNAAVAAVYRGDVEGAATMLRAASQGDRTHIVEPLVLNSCVVSDLGSPDPVASRAALAAMVATASDDFDAIAAMGMH
jgi:hypothetical protein